MRSFLLLFSLLVSSIYAFADSNSEAWPAPETEAPAPPKYCLPDLKKWSFSSVFGTYYLNEATIFTVKSQRFIKIWVSRLKNADECTFEKEFVTIDCISNASGEDWYSVNPVDPDDGYYEVVKDICKAFPEKRAPAKKAPTKKK